MAELPWGSDEAGKLLYEFTVQVYENGIHVDNYGTCDENQVLETLQMLLSLWNHPEAKAYDNDGNEVPR